MGDSRGDWAFAKESYNRNRVQSLPPSRAYRLVQSRWAHQCGRESCRGETSEGAKYELNQAGDAGTGRGQDVGMEEQDRMTIKKAAASRNRTPNIIICQCHRKPRHSDKDLRERGDCLPGHPLAHTGPRAKLGLAQEPCPYALVHTSDERRLPR
ncbi:hypothetical protein BO94DRAFT_371674 [Aspergillus sclerotioniger CBS 115572]|uniref:Uncharacterized protein n=1 Tax=Aspergillus sclerotioniger CBS 115572 TaxID=1450535 RepID=A0A317X4S4_9EURO|nr:hypothetical protein BO94DRAFT_371674 [Aspergillus sclerotioniger CBS 115572]PWY93335.1 hypothetical protein BO94DRAFT_371674 [Aspergillus sclerotioniger CBS 115572]